jgi:hypothetical protein
MFVRMKRLWWTLLILFLLVSPAAIGQSNINNGGSSSGSATVPNAQPQFGNDTIYPATSSACTTESIVGTTYCARNNQTGALDGNSTDIRALWDTLVGIYTAGGQFQFKNGIYSCNTLDQESTGGFSNFYCIGIPGGGSTQYSQWILDGESSPPLIDQFDSTPAQTNGVVLNLTAAAVSSVAANSKIMIIWARPDTVNGVGAQVFEKNIGLRVPTNQRGCETQSDLTQSLSVDYENVNTDTAVAEASVAFPVEASCVSWGGTDPGGLIALTGTGSVKQENWFRRVLTEAADIGIDARSEHTILEHVLALRGNHGIDYGFRGGPVTHSSVWIEAGCGEVARCLSLGPNLQLGSALTTWGFDSEDACVSTSPAFVPVYHALETNVGFTNGIISFSISKQGGCGVTYPPVPNFWDGGGGTSFSVLQATSQHNIARTPALDTFTRANATSIGPAWQIAAYSGYNPNLQIVSNSAQLVQSGVAVASAAYIGQVPSSSEQFSQVTVASIDSSSSSFGAALTNISIVPTTQTYYEYYCSHAAATGSGIQKVVAGTPTSLVSQTSTAGCNAGDTLRLYHIGTTLIPYRNGAPDANLHSVTDSTISNGNPGFILSQDATNAVSLTNFEGGTFPTVTGADSIYSQPEFAPTYNTITNCVSSASPAVCGSAAAGSVVVPTGTTSSTLQVNSTQVTANSQIFFYPDDSLGTRLGVTCNSTLATLAGGSFISARAPGTSFTITFNGSILTNGVCGSYLIFN